MNMLRRSLLALPLLAFAAPAFAQPGTYPAPDDAPPPQYPAPIYAPAPPPAYPAPVAAAPSAAPQNTDWNNVSNINGQLVPVGQHNDYTYTFRKTNISSNPIGWLAGIYGVSVSYALSDHIALRGDVNLFNNAFGSNVSGYEVGISLPIYLRRTYQGPFIEPGIISRGFSDSDDCDGCGSSTMSSAVGPEMMVGYQWMFDSGLNVAAAFGLAKMTNTNESSDNPADLEPAGYFRVGYAF